MTWSPPATTPEHGTAARPSADAHPLTILHVVAPGKFGGLERVVQSLCFGLRRNGHRVHLAIVAPEPEAARQLLAPLAHTGVCAHPLVLPARAYLQEHRALIRLAVEVQPDVIHTHGYRPDVLAGWVARRTGIPALTTMHGFTHATWKLRLYERLQRGVVGSFDAVVAVSRQLAEQLVGEGIPPARVHVIPNAWLQLQAPLGRAGARRALGLAGQSGKLIGWIGRLSPEKGPDVMLEALARLDDLPLRLAIVGDGAERQALERQAARLGVAPRVHWCGGVPEAGRLFAAFDVFALSSRTEGTPIAVFEAMAAHTPIVAAAVGGVPDVLPHGTALLVPPGDPQALADAVRDVFRAPRHATSRATAARTRLLTRFEPRRWIEAYERLYRQICRRGPLAVASR